ncbi:MAG: SIMPL domain-containing protein [Ginsengibacter sp.]
MEIPPNEKIRIAKIAVIFMIIVSAYFAVRIISEVKGLSFIGGGIPATNTMSFDGTGEVTAVPDMATINFTIVEDSKEVKDAQNKVTTIETAALNFLDKNGVDKKDIQTQNYSSYPKYDYGTPCSGLSMPCRPTNPTIIGYEVSEYVSVKIHDLTNVGTIVQGIGGIGVSNMDGPNFSIENEDTLKEQARKLAIDQAKDKAQTLARDLGVQLVRIVNFSENGNSPIMYAKGMALDSVAAPSAPAPALPTGENKITSNVSITYEIR